MATRNIYILVLSSLLSLTFSSCSDYNMFSNNSDTSIKGTWILNKEICNDMTFESFTKDNELKLEDGVICLRNKKSNAKEELGSYLFNKSDMTLQVSSNNGLLNFKVVGLLSNELVLESVVDGHNCKSYYSR